MFVTGDGKVSERNDAIYASEELGRKGQEVREMTRDLDLLKLDKARHRRNRHGGAPARHTGRDRHNDNRGPARQRAEHFAGPVLEEIMQSAGGPRASITSLRS